MEDLDFSAVKFENVTNTESETDYVRLNISYTDRDGFLRTGDVVVRLFPEVAPNTVANFKELVSDGFYDGLTFHRVYNGFMIQGGDPEGDGTGDSGRTIKGEFTANGFTNNLRHVRGVLSMARGGYSNDSASCQFFIMHEDTASLDGQYASFGYVVYGMDTVDGIAATKVEKSSPTATETTSPVNPVTINYATFVTVSK
ncbi:MAG: peptidylprolyl isomerase [Clostridia bacterium]|nr:peptidylprolyl isomerase [Clostridia bacterium]